jgi:hypothetical protein
MWQPGRAQWVVIWTVAIVAILAWPPADGRSLGVKAVNWASDPSDSLPHLPKPLPMGLDDNGDAVEAHDLAEAEYYRVYNAGGFTQLRLRLKSADDPIDATTTRQLLAGLIVLGVLTVWRLETGRTRRGG